MFIAEGLVIGLAGASIGLGLGYALARSALGAVASAISALYMPIKVASIVVHASDVAIASALGVCAAVFAAFIPARRAPSIDPLDAMTGTVQSSNVALSVSISSFHGAAAAFAGAVLLAAAAHL